MVAVNIDINVGLARTVYLHRVYDRMYGDFPAKTTVCTPYIPINVWLRPTLQVCCQFKLARAVMALLQEWKAPGSKAELLGGNIHDSCMEIFAP